MFKMLRNDKRGFTLVELLVVIAVIGILAAIAIPRFGGFQDRAREAAHKSELGQVRQAIGYHLVQHSAFTNLDNLKDYLGEEFNKDGFEGVDAIESVKGNYKPGDGSRVYHLNYETTNTITAKVRDSGKIYTYTITQSSITQKSVVPAPSPGT